MPPAGSSSLKLWIEISWNMKRWNCWDVLWKDGFQTLLSPDENFGQHDWHVVLSDPRCFTAVFSPEQRNQFLWSPWASAPWFHLEHEDRTHHKLIMKSLNFWKKHPIKSQKPLFFVAFWRKTSFANPSSETKKRGRHTSVPFLGVKISPSFRRNRAMFRKLLWEGGQGCGYLSCHSTATWEEGLGGFSRNARCDKKIQGCHGLLTFCGKFLWIVVQLRQTWHIFGNDGQRIMHATCKKDQIGLREEDQRFRKRTWQNVANCFLFFCKTCRNYHV